jgi:ATP-dependent helicase/nuclease subunit A
MLAVKNNTLEYNPPADAPQRLQAISIHHSVAVVAPAGSGKTSLLLARFLNALVSVGSPEEVLAITFTNDAANEIRERVIHQIKSAGDSINPVAPHEQHVRNIAVEVHKKDKELGWNLTTNPHRLRIMTIDAYCAKLVADMPVTTGIGGSIKPVDDPRHMYREAVLNTLSMATTSLPNSEASQCVIDVLSYVQYRYESLLAPMQDLLSKRDQWLLLGRSFNIEDANAFLTNYVHGACFDLKSELSRLDGESLIADISAASAFSSKLSFFADYKCLPNESNVEFYQRLTSFLLTGAGTIRKTFTVRDGIEGEGPSAPRIKEWAKSVSGHTALEAALQKIQGLPPAVYQGEDLEFVGSFFKFYELCIASLIEVFEHYSRCDFTEISLRAHIALGDDVVGYGDSMLREDRIAHLMVDEMQDTSYAQEVMLEKLVGAWVDDIDKKRTIAFYGDLQQSIYKFRGAEPGLFKKIWVEGVFAGIKLSPLSLTTNFRSGPGLVDHFNDVFSPLFTGKSDLFIEAQSYKESGTKIEYISYVENTFEEEAKTLVAMLKEKIEYNPLQSVAVLARNRSHFADVIKELRSEGIKYGGKDLVKMVDMDHVRPVLSLVDVLVNAHNRLAWIEIARSSLVGLTWHSINELMNVHANTDFMASLKTFASNDAFDSDQRTRAGHLINAFEEGVLSGDAIGLRVKRIWMALKGHLMVSEDQQVDINTVFRCISEHSCGAELVSYTRFTQRIKSLYSTSTGGQVMLMTFHGCKGLEFDHVFVLGLSRESRNHKPDIAEFDSFDGTVLIGGSKQKDSRLFKFIHQSKKQDSINEELRILYVALTRAKKALTVFCGSNDETGEPVAPKKSTMLSYIYERIAGRIQKPLEGTKQATLGVKAGDLSARSVIDVSECSVWKLPVQVGGSADLAQPTEEQGDLFNALPEPGDSVPVAPANEGALLADMLKASMNSKTDALATRLLPMLKNEKLATPESFVASHESFIKKYAYEMGVGQDSITVFIAHFTKVFSYQAKFATLPF